MRPLRWLVVVFAFAACSADAQPPPMRAGQGAVVASSPERLAEAIQAERPKPVVVNYWATWCEPCKKEMPRLIDAVRHYGSRVAFIGVNVEDDLQAARSFVARYGVPFRSYALSRAEVQSEQDILGLPVTQFYGDDGELALVHQGEISKRDLEDKIDEVLRASRPAG